MDIDKETLRADVLKFIQKTKTAVLSTVSPEHQPEAATVTYVCDDDFNFYFITKKDSRKLQNILKNPNVAIVVGTSENPATAQMQGVAEIITDPDHFIVTYFSQSVNVAETKWWPLFKVRGSDFAFVKVKITWLRWLNLDLTEYPETYKDDFQQIIP